METLPGELLLYIANRLRWQKDVIRWSTVCKFVRTWLTTHPICLKLEKPVMSVPCLQRAIAAFSHVQSITLDGPDITDQHVTALASLRRLQTISFTNCHYFRRRYVQQLIQQNRTSLVNFSLHGKSPCEVMGIGESLSALETVVLSSSKISPIEFSGVLACPALRNLMIYDCDRLSEFDLQKLATCNRLRRLIVDVVMPLARAQIHDVARCKTLEVLILMCEETDDYCVTKLATLPNLRRLTIGRSDNVTDGCGMDLSRCPRLEYLHLDFCSQITPAIHCAFARSLTMRTLVLGRGGTCDVFFLDSTGIPPDVLCAYIYGKLAKVYRFNTTMDDHPAESDAVRLRQFNAYLIDHGEYATTHAYFEWLSPS